MTAPRHKRATEQSIASPGGKNRPAPETTRILDFEDNRLLTDLFGEHDRHLTRIEERLGVRATPRGNRVALAGGEAACHQAENVLRDLYAKLEDGRDIGTGDVDGAIRMAEEPWAEERKSGGAPEIVTRRRVIQARSPAQAVYIKALQENELVFGTGPAGTGKTYLAAAFGVSLMLQKKVDRLILSRPAVEAGERLGFLPGDMREKVDPYLRPLYDALYDTLPGEHVVRGLESGEIEVAPLAFMRGRTLSNSFVILDEAQNATTVQMKMFLTRLGENSRMVVTGDPSQIDLPLGAKSGLIDALDTLDGVNGVASVRFTDRDVVRHPLVTRIVQAYGRKETGLLDDTKRGGPA